jgi:threonine aldolase
MQYIDLRSDTVTKPSEGMRRAMAEAPVGDDVFGDDPTMNALQERVADMLGKEAALFTASGSMANTVAVLAHTQPGDEVIVEREGHTFNYEVGAPAALGGVQLHHLTGLNGILEQDQVEAAIRPDDVHIPPTRLIILENTHNRGGGKIYPLDKIKEIRQLAKRHDIPMHLDGARIFNASVASGIDVKEVARQFDSLMFCFSKGLGAPVGSVIAGSKTFIKRAHRARKLLGGGMRQVGILAAAAHYALDNNITRLAEDHENAQTLAQGISAIDGFEIDPDSVETNIVVFDVSGSEFTVEKVVQKLNKKGILMIPFGANFVRAVTHLDVNAAQIQQTVEVMQEIF